MVLGVVREQSNPTFEAVLAARPLERRVGLSALLATDCSPGVAGRSVLANHTYYEAVAAVSDTKAARDRFAPATGSLEADWPLSLVQIDHTLVDVIVVDKLTREPIQRPWLTLAIDVCSRCVVGIHLTLEPPSAMSVALCIAHGAKAKASAQPYRDDSASRTKTPKF
jgi:transposase InsO family protein